MIEIVDAFIMWLLSFVRVDHLRFVARRQNQSVCQTHSPRGRLTDVPKLSKSSNWDTYRGM